MSTRTCRVITPPAVPCQIGDPNLWFAIDAGEIERAKTLCASCPIRRECLAAALQRQEPWGVWGGVILEHGTIVAGKRRRGRPRKINDECPQPNRVGGVPYQRCSVRPPHLYDEEVV